VLGNSQAGRPDGKCNREQTADGPMREQKAQARVKRWGKSPPACRETGTALQTPPGARSDRDVGGPPVKSRVDRTEVDGDVGPRWMIAPERLLRTESGLQADSHPEPPLSRGFGVLLGLQDGFVTQN